MIQGQDYNYTFQHMAYIDREIHHSPSEVTHDRRHQEHMGVHRALLAHITNPENVVTAEDGRKCGDGRYEEINGKLARFGADGGYVLALLSINRTKELGFTPMQIVDAVVDSTEGMFSIHSDEAAEKIALETDDPSKIGCGHLAKAVLPENEQDYMVYAPDVAIANEYMKNLAILVPEKVEMVFLRGAHKERGVIINTGFEKKIRHGDGYNQWFVVGAAKDQEYSNVLFERIMHRLPELREAEVTQKDFREVLDKQTAATGRLLAKGLPVFLVNLDTELPLVETLPSF